MADKRFGVRELVVLGSGIPKIKSPNNLNLDAVNVAISTNITVGGDLDVDGHTELDAVNVSGVATATSFKTGNIEIFDSGPAVYVRTNTSGNNLLITEAQNGAHISHYGNSYVVNTMSGQLYLSAGNVSTGDIVFNTGGSARVRIDYDGSVDFTHQVTAASFVKTGGTSSQYLMADGSTSNATSSATFNITTTSPSSSYYTLNGSDRNGSVSGNNAGVTVYVGDTINFNLSSVSVSHPFYLKTLQGTGTSNQVSTPIATGQGSTGTATVSWTPNAAGAYYYQCSNHNAMHGIISVQTAPAGGGSTDLLEIMLFT